MEERLVSSLELAVLVLTLITGAVGGWSIYWARVEPPCWRCRGGRILFLVNLLALGAISLIAALARAQGLPPLGLVAGLLIVGMMWDGPARDRRRAPAGVQPIAPQGPAN
jgi:hypothetical protein